MIYEKKTSISQLDESKTTKLLISVNKKKTYLDELNKLESKNFIHA